MTDNFLSSPSPKSIKKKALSDIEVYCTLELMLDMFIITGQGTSTWVEVLDVTSDPKVRTCLTLSL